MFRKTCMLCQRTSLKRWFGNRTMTSNCDVTNSAHQIQMTTLCRWMNPPHENFLRTPQWQAVDRFLSEAEREFSGINELNEMFSFLNLHALLQSGNNVVCIKSVGRGGRWSKAPLEFEIWHFPIKFLAKKGRFLSFEWVKSNFATFGPPLEKYFWPGLEKFTFPPPEKNPCDAHGWHD